MRHGEASGDRLPAEACRDAASLRTFVEGRISANAWPIHSRPLRKLVRIRGLDLAAAREFRPSLDDLADLLHLLHARLRRMERTLRIDNAFHRTLHNFEVFLRLLLLEWPIRQPLPEDLRRAAERPYRSLAAVGPVLLELMRRLLELGLPAWRLARDLLAAVGHDYGHTGGTDRLDRTGTPLPLTHEETAERHVAKLGIDSGFPPALVLESLAGIRATTFHSRPGRSRIQAMNEFERKLTLADVTGCVLPADRWLTHVAMPVLKEKIDTWGRRLTEIPEEVGRLERELAALPEGNPAGLSAERRRRSQRLAALAAENEAIVKHVPEFFKSELGFLRFIRSHRLAAVPSGERLWGEVVDRKIARLERVLARGDLLEPIEGRGFELLAELASELANLESLESWLAGPNVDPHVRAVFDELLDHRTPAEAGTDRIPGTLGDG